MVSRRRGRRILGRALPFALAAAVLVALGVSPAAATTAPAAAIDSETCSTSVTEETPVPRQIDLVIDDSGSMFQNDSTGEVLTRWSQAKYSLEVFAAMMEQQDTLRVFRMSDFRDGNVSGPVLSMTGTQSPDDRVGQVRSMDMLGYDTPYEAVLAAQNDLLASPAPIRWLVVLTDGAFETPEAFRDTAAVQGNLEAFAASNSSATVSTRVAFLAIGGAPAIASSTLVVADQAPGSADLVSKVTEFANRIFERNVLPQSQLGRVDPDIPLEQVLVFAQGASVSVGDLDGADDSISPSSFVAVQSVDAPTEFVGRYNNLPTQPDTTLAGVLATYDDVPPGAAAVDVTANGVPDIGIFYKPKAQVAVKLTDENGDPVDATKIVGGQYTLDYGFVDDSCAFITQSPLLGDVDYSATVTVDGEPLLDGVEPGQSVELPAGDAQVAVTATYLGGITTSETIDLTVLQPARETTLEAEPASFDVSTLTADSDQAIDLSYALASGDAFDQDVWDAIDPADLVVTSDSNLVFDVEKTDTIGGIRVIPHAPDGDVLEADTGEIPLSLDASFVYDEQLYETSTDTDFTVVDDISFWDRFVDWFGEIGWKLLLLLLLLILILGYVFKRRFSKKIKKRPTIEGIPATPGVRPETGFGKFRVLPLRRFLPFVADRATLSYVLPGVVGFAPLKLTAGKGKSMSIDNWKAVAQRKNVDVGGTELNEETRRPPALRATTMITARTPQVQYQMTPNA